MDLTSRRMERIMNTRMLITLMIGWMITCLFWFAPTTGAHKPPRKVPYMFVFGDSLADAGTNNYVPNCTLTANFPPYGIDYFPCPTGRFSNGRTAFDFLAQFLELPLFPPPYLQPHADFSCGINFASGGSGLLDSTEDRANIIDMSQQMLHFRQYSKLLKQKRGGESDLAKSLYCISIGGNDIFDYIYNISSGDPVQDPGEYVTSMLKKFEEYVTMLYNEGARNFLVLEISVVGCTPAFRQANNGSCVDVANKMAKGYNSYLHYIVGDLNKKVPGMTIILLNTYSYFKDVIEHGAHYGFSETKSACCGSGRFRAEGNCGQPAPSLEYCHNREKFVFWDKFHPTQKVYKFFAKKIWDGNSSYMYPYNLSTLVEREEKTF